MNRSKRSGLLLLLLSLPLLSGCLLTVQSGHHTDRAVVETVEHHHGPPAHAKAHGYRDKYVYQYYPAADVYLDTGRDVYFYLDSDGDWEMSASLPYSLSVRLGEHVAIEMDTDQPYIKNHEHKKKYPPGKYKKKKRKKKMTG